jgi:hypothetical protein
MLSNLIEWLQANPTILGAYTALVIGVLMLIRDKLPTKLANRLGYDVDQDDLRAMKQLESRAERRGCPKLKADMEALQRDFFNKRQPPKAEAPSE